MIHCRQTKKSGFTIVEIIVVVIIVGLISSFALPRAMGSMERVRAAEGVQMLTALLGAQKAFRFETGNYANNPNLLDVEITRAAYFNIPPIVQNNAARVASITRTGGYTLRIDENGVITCANSGPITCAQAGY